MGDERSIWESLVPRLIHPTKLAIVEALRSIGCPLSVDDLLMVLGPDEGRSREHVGYYLKSMVRSGVIEVAEVRPRPSEGRDEFFVFFGFPPPPAESSSASATAAV